MPKLIEISPGLYISQYSHAEIEHLSAKPMLTEWVHLIRESQLFTDEQKDEILNPEQFGKHFLSILENHCEEHHPYIGKILPKL